MVCVHVYVTEEKMERMNYISIAINFSGRTDIISWNPGSEKQWILYQHLE